MLPSGSDYLYVPATDADFEVGEHLREALVLLAADGPPAELTPQQAAGLARVRDLWVGEEAPLA